MQLSDTKLHNAKVLRVNEKAKKIKLTAEISGKLNFLPGKYLIPSITTIIYIIGKMSIKILKKFKLFYKCRSDNMTFAFQIKKIKNYVQHYFCQV